MGTFRSHRRRNLFHCGVVIAWPFLVLPVHGKAVRFTLVAGLAPVSGELFFWLLLGTHAEAARCQAICFVHFTHRLQTRHPQPSFIIAQNQTSRWPATSPFPNRGTSFPWHFPEIPLWRKMEWFWLERLVGCQTKLGQRDIPCKSGSPSKAWASFGFTSEAAHELKTRAAGASRVYEGSRMFMIINEPISATAE